MVPRYQKSAAWLVAMLALLLQLSPLSAQEAAAAPAAREATRSIAESAQRRPQPIIDGHRVQPRRAAWCCKNKNPHIRRCTGLGGCGDPQPALFASGCGQSPSCKPPSHGGNTGSNPVGDANLVKQLETTETFPSASYGKYTEKSEAGPRLAPRSVCWLLVRQRSQYGNQSSSAPIALRARSRILSSSCQRPLPCWINPTAV